MSFKDFNLFIDVAVFQVPELEDRLASLSPAVGAADVEAVLNDFQSQVQHTPSCEIRRLIKKHNVLYSLYGEKGLSSLGSLP